MSYSDYEPQESWNATPAPWDQASERSPTRVRILYSLYRHSEPMLEYYAKVLIPSRPRPTPVGALLLLWERWDLGHARCGGCGGIGLVTGVSGLDSSGSMSGYCLGCEHIVRRDNVDGIGASVMSAVHDVSLAGYDLPISVPRGWSLRGRASALVAALQELGAEGLPPIRKARL